MEFLPYFCRQIKKRGAAHGTPFIISLIQQGVSIRRLRTTFHNVRCYGLLKLRYINRLSLGSLLPRTYVFCLQM